MVRTEAGSIANNVQENVIGDVGMNFEKVR
jgi:hypothetical protein